MAPPANVHYRIATIAAGAALSDAVDCTSGSIIRIDISADWRSANLSLQLSTDGITFFDVFDHAGKEFLSPAIPGTSMQVSVGSIFAFIKFRSGSRENPVPQNTTQVIGITQIDG